MSERTVYERVVQVPREGYAHYEYVPLDPNPLDEIEKLQATADRFEDTIVSLRGLLRKTIGALETHWLSAINCDHDVAKDNPVCACMEEFLGWHDSVGAAVRTWVDHIKRVVRIDVLDGECKHDRGWLHPVAKNGYGLWALEGGGVFENRRVCRLCGAPASEVKA